jgi:hypothetical protein
MDHNPSSNVSAAPQRSGDNARYHLATAAVFLAVLASPVLVAAQEGFGNYAAALGAATVQSSQVKIPYGARASVAAPRTARHRIARRAR